VCGAEPGCRVMTRQYMQCMRARDEHREVRMRSGARQAWRRS
jgi:hypothetical protein